MEFEFIDKALYFPVEKILVMTDLHVGFEEAINKSGVLLPRHQQKETLKDLKSIFEKLEKEKKNIKEIILLGDIKHEFGEISKQEWRDTFRVLRFLLGKCENLIITKGNHDNILGPILKKFPKIRFEKIYFNKKTAFFHGLKKDFKDKGLKDKKIKRIVVGHFHPSITISEKSKREKYKCFLVGKYKGKQMIILPSFFSLREGVNILGRTKPGFLEGHVDVRNFEIFILGDKIYDFGKVKDIV